MKSNLFLILLFVIGVTSLYGQDFVIKHQFDGGITLLGMETNNGITVIDAFANKQVFLYDGEIQSIRSCLLETNDRRVLIIRTEDQLSSVRGGEHYIHVNGMTVTARVLVADTFTYCDKEFITKGDQGGHEILVLNYNKEGQLVNSKTFENKSSSAYSLRDIQHRNDSIILTGTYYYDDFWMDRITLETYSRGQAEGFYAMINVNSLEPLKATRLNGLNDDKVLEVVVDEKEEYIIVESNSPESCFDEECAETGLKISWRTNAAGIISRDNFENIQAFKFLSHTSGTSFIQLTSKNETIVGYGLFSSDSIDVFGNLIVRRSLDAGFVVKLDKELNSVVSSKVEATDQLNIVDALIRDNKIVLIGTYEGQLIYNDVVIKESSGINLNSFLLILDVDNLSLVKSYNLHANEGMVYAIRFVNIEGRRMLQLYLRNVQDLSIGSQPLIVSDSYSTGSLIVDISDHVLTKSFNYHSVDPKLNLFPNPTKDIVHYSLEGDEIKSLYILTPDGHIQHSSVGSLNSIGQVSLERLPAAVYFLKITTNKGNVFVQKIVKL